MLESEKNRINTLILNDEGGWKLTADKNDTDGGWTFAGVTANTWGKYQHVAFTHDQMAHFIAADLEEAKDIVYDIYYKEYLAPLTKELKYTPTDAQFSCMINIGMEKAIELVEKATSVNGYFEKDFLKAWHLYYCDLIKQNAEAWRDYALALEVPYKPDSLINVPVKPKTLRAEYINGWFNRVERYRDA